MNRIVVVAMGPGNVKFMLQEAISRLQESDVIIGSLRQIEDIKNIASKETKLCVYKKLHEIEEAIRNNSKESISILVSGDSGYYSLVPYLKKNVEEDFMIIPGISSFQYLFSKLRENWQEYSLGSVHGRKIDYKKFLLEDNKGIVLLTDEEENPKKIAKELYELGFRDLCFIIGENLSYEEEKISTYAIENWEDMPVEFAMNVCICKKGEKDAYL